MWGYFSTQNVETSIENLVINSSRSTNSTYIYIYIYILLIRGFSCFVFNFWRTKISTYKFENNILFNLIFFSYKKAKNVKTLISSHVQRKKKKKPLFSPPICIQISYFYLYLLFIWIQILQLSLSNKK